MARISDISGGVIRGGDGAAVRILFDDGRDLVELDVTADEARSLLACQAARVQAPPRPTLADIRERYPRAYEPWTPEEDLLLARLHAEGRSLAEMIAALERQPGGIRSRLRRLRLVDRRSPTAAAMARRAAAGLLRRT